jgi:hypothetical protein
MALWRENGYRKAKTLGNCNKMTKAEVEDKLRKAVQPVNEKSGTVE